MRKFLRHHTRLTAAHPGFVAGLVARFVCPPDRLALGRLPVGRCFNRVSLLHQLDAALREPRLEDRRARRRLVGQNFLDLIAQALLELSDRRAVAAVFPRRLFPALAALRDAEAVLSHQRVVRLRYLPVQSIGGDFAGAPVVIDHFDVVVRMPTCAVHMSNHQCVGIGVQPFRQHVPEIIDRLNVVSIADIEVAGRKRLDQTERLDLATERRRHPLGMLDELLDGRPVAGDRGDAVGPGGDVFPPLPCPFAAEHLVLDRRPRMRDLPDVSDAHRDVPPRCSRTSRITDATSPSATIRSSCSWKSRPLRRPALSSRTI